MKKSDAIYGHILVVEDDEDFSEMLVSYLESQGYQASLATDGTTALDLINRYNFQTILLDLGLPDMDGMEVLRQLQKQNHRAPIIVITGSGTIENAVAAIKAGAYDFIAKPLDFKVFEVVVERALVHNQLLRQSGLFRGLVLALLISVPVWLLIGVVLSMWYFE